MSSILQLSSTFTVNIKHLHIFQRTFKHFHWLNDWLRSNINENLSYASEWKTTRVVKICEHYKSFIWPEKCFEVQAVLFLSYIVSVTLLREQSIMIGNFVVSSAESACLKGTRTIVLSWQFYQFNWLLSFISSAREQTLQSHWNIDFTQQVVVIRRRTKIELWDEVFCWQFPVEISCLRLLQHSITRRDRNDVCQYQ